MCVYRGPELCLEKGGFPRRKWFYTPQTMPRVALRVTSTFGAPWVLWSVVFSVGSSNQNRLQVRSHSPPPSSLPTLPPTTLPTTKGLSSGHPWFTPLDTLSTPTEVSRDPWYLYRRSVEGRNEVGPWRRNRVRTPYKVFDFTGNRPGMGRDLVLPNTNFPSPKH